ncbi:MAG TPA: class II aldolase/adducin family protein [Chloroflexota bacterium]|nr:class II aldolase/adducin family protein [Chloroflexota bacterium]
MNDDVELLRRQCFLGARFLWQELREIYGHVSVRLPDGKGFLLMFTRVPEPPLDPDEILTFDYEGNRLMGDTPTPYEITLHTEIYRKRPDVQSVVHSHPHMATALTTAGKTVYATTQQSKVFGTGVPVFKGDFITDVEIGKELADCLGDQPAALMKGHGCVVVGRHVPDAITNVLYLEQAAKQQIWASMLGGTPELLPDRVLNHRFPAEYAAGHNQASTNLWRQLVWEWEHEQAHEHGHAHSHER